MIQNFKYKIVIWYCVIFYILAVYKFSNGLFLFQLQPSFFYLREDIFTWMFMQTGLHRWLLNNLFGWLLFDSFFYLMPLLYFLHFRMHYKTAGITAFIMLAVNVCYYQCYTLYPTTSIEGYIGWLLFPVVFIPANEKTFTLLFKGLRYFFLYFIVSAGLWKLLQGGAFNTQQMSGILLLQHKDLLITSPGYWQTNFISWLIKHSAASYILYLLVTIIELSFLAGFFTIKYDKILLPLFIIFLIADYFIMRIAYFEVSALLLTLYFHPLNGRKAAS